MKVKRALISVSDKKGVVEFARGLNRLGVEIISTGGTAKLLQKEGVPVKAVSEITNFPEMLGGRVKTLHPAIHGAVLAKRTKDHLLQLKEQGIDPIDLVVVNLYPFSETIAKKNVSMDEAVEQIDIGGPTMVRAAAKNFESVAVVTDPTRYDEILAELEKSDRILSREMRLDLAREAFRLTAEYDATIYHYLEEEKDFPPFLKLIYQKIQDLRYGENPHQRAAYYRERFAPESSLVFAEKLGGKELSYNNILDLDSAWRLAKEFTEPACVIIKHNNPCGVAEASGKVAAYESALACDPVSAFGGIIAFNQEVGKETAEKVSQTFIEAIIAPGFTQEALDVLTQKKDLRLMDAGSITAGPSGTKDIRTVDGGILVQDKDEGEEHQKEKSEVTTKKSSKEEWQDLIFAWKVAKHVKSNTIVYAKNRATVGIGAGQMSRIDAAEIGIRKAEKSGLQVKGTVLASDAFFPFPDVAELAAKRGITAIIQPGGSIRDKEVIEACDKEGISMVFTGTRHFRH